MIGGSGNIIKNKKKHGIDVNANLEQNKLNNTLYLIPLTRQVEDKAHIYKVVDTKSNNAMTKDQYQEQLGIWTKGTQWQQKAQQCKEAEDKKTSKTKNQEESNKKCSVA